MVFVGLVTTIGSIPACAGEPLYGPAPESLTWVYPRVCGGTVLISDIYAVARGLSPRVRGNLFTPLRGFVLRRSIPACAGEPFISVRSASSYWVYPRVCGGTGTHSRMAGFCAGLSPRVRGNPLGPPPHRGRPGSIPACAGEPLCCLLSITSARVYPRVCGGTDQCRVVRHRADGLSPRVRGNPSTSRSGSNMIGSIPACAGEPRRRHRKLRSGWVYPRVCGGTS